MSVFDKWNESINWNEFDKEMEEIKQNGGTGSGHYDEVPHGEYEVAIEKMELKESKKGDPMLSVWFKILTGEHKGQYIFMNQVVVTPFQSHVVDEFLKSLDTSIEIESLTVDHDYKRYSDMINDVYEQVNGHLEYLLNYSQNKKGYNTFSIIEVYECE